MPQILYISFEYRLCFPLSVYHCLGAVAVAVVYSEHNMALFGGSSKCEEVGTLG